MMTHSHLEAPADHLHARLHTATTWYHEVWQRTVQYSAVQSMYLTSCAVDEFSSIVHESLAYVECWTVV